MRQDSRGESHLNDEMKHVNKDPVRLQPLQPEGRRQEAKTYPLKVLCRAECNLYERWAWAMSFFSPFYTHLTDPHQY
jgi:hypothetical protein